MLNTNFSRRLGVLLLALLFAGPALAQTSTLPLRARPASSIGKPVASLHKSLVDETVSYYNISRLFDLSIVRDRPAVGIFVTAPFDGTLDQIDFELSNFPPSPGVAGTGTLRIKIVEIPILPLNPRDFADDSLDIPFSQLNAKNIVTPNNLANQIDISDRDFQVEGGKDYFVQFSLVNASPDAALTFVFDGGTTDTLDTDYFPPRTWVYLQGNAVPPGEDDGYYPLDDPNSDNFSLNLVAEFGFTRGEIDPEPQDRGLVQFIHNAAGVNPVDIYVNDSLVTRDLGYLQATDLRSVPAGAITLDIAPGTELDNSNPLVSSTITFEADTSQFVVLAGVEDDLSLIHSVYPTENIPGDEVSFLVVNAAYEAGPLAFNVLDMGSTHNVILTFADNLAFGEVAAPRFLETEPINFEIADADDDAQIEVFFFDLFGQGGASLVVLPTGLRDGNPPLALMAARADGTVILTAACGANVTLCINTAVEPGEGPAGFALHANYPNPFNPVTTITFDLGAPGFTTLRVFDVLGREVATPVSTLLPAGAHQIAFDAAELPSGTYFYRLESGSFQQQRMLTLVK